MNLTCRTKPLGEWLRISNVLAVTGTVWSLACSSSAEPVKPSAPSPLRIGGAYSVTASSSQVRDPNPRLQYAVTVTNRSAVTEQLEYGGCWAYVRFFKNADRSGSPAYDAAVPNGGVCTADLNRVPLAPGASTSMIGHFELVSVLVLGVSPGHYSVSLLIAPDGVVTSVPAGEVELQP